MPLDGIPWWANALGGLIGGSAITEGIRAMKARGQAMSTERLTLQQGEAEFRSALLAENREQRERLDRLENRVMELVENERKCDERNSELEAEVGALRERNDELRRDLDAISSALDEQSRRIISESSSERRANRESLRSLREGVAHNIDVQKARHGS